MRTTLTLDEDIATKLKAAARRSGRPFKDLVNETLRRGLLTVRPAARQPFHVRTRSLGGLQPGLGIDNIGELLERIEGPRHR